MYETIFLGLACLCAPLLAKYAGYENGKKAFHMVGLSGLFFLLAASFSLVFTGDRLGMFGLFTLLGHYGLLLSYFLGWLMMLLGVVLELMGTLFMPTHAHR